MDCLPPPPGFGAGAKGEVVSELKNVRKLMSDAFYLADEENAGGRLARIIEDALEEIDSIETPARRAPDPALAKRLAEMDGIATMLESVAGDCVIDAAIAMVERWDDATANGRLARARQTPDLLALLRRAKEEK